MADSTRTRILEACARRIAADGIRGMRVSDVAKEAGVSVGLVYYHFNDREGLMSATLSFVHEASRERLPDRHPDSVAPDTDPVRATLLTDIADTAAVRDNSIVWNEIRAIAVFEEALRDSLAESTQQWQADLERDLAGAALRLPADRAAVLLTAIIEGVSGRWLTGQLSTAEARALVSDAWQLVQSGPGATDDAREPRA